jgi:mannose-1-phosphate guanylyltransferase
VVVVEPSQAQTAQVAQAAVEMVEMPIQAQLTLAVVVAADHILHQRQELVEMVDLVSSF